MFDRPLNCTCTNRLLDYQKKIRVQPRENKLGTNKYKDIQFLRVMHLNGPNIWTFRSVIEAWVDIGLLEDFPSNKLPGFNERLNTFLPSLMHHTCGSGMAGGFLQRLDEGTWIGHVLEHVAIELQCLAGMDTRFGKTRGTSVRGIYKLVFRTFNEKVGRAALDAGRSLVMAAINDTPHDIDRTVSQLRALVNSSYLDSVTQYIIPTAEARYIPVIRLPDSSVIQLGYGVAQRRLQQTDIDQFGESLVDRLFALDDSNLVPIVGIAGSCGTSLVAHLVAWFLHRDGQFVGMACDDGLYLNNAQVVNKSCTDCDGVMQLLTHPHVESIVFVTSNQMILSQGLVYNECDVAIVTDAAGHEELSEFYIHEQDHLYKVLHTQVEAAKRAGFVVLNAMEPLLVEMADDCAAKVIFYATNADVFVVEEHRNKEGRAVFLRDNWLVLANGLNEMPLLSLSEMNQTMVTQAESILAAVAAGWAMNFDSQELVDGLTTFEFNTNNITKKLESNV